MHVGVRLSCSYGRGRLNKGGEKDEEDREKS
jgi:hypothetical protein